MEWVGYLDASTSKKSVNHERCTSKRSVDQTRYYDSRYIKDYGTSSSCEKDKKSNRDAPASKKKSDLKHYLVFKIIHMCSKILCIKAIDDVID